MSKLKKISKTAVPAALKMAERYRLLNEPSEAESICLDILEIDPSNNKARIMLILALSDQLPDRSAAYEEALEEINELKIKYDRAYYTGILYERHARAHFKKRSLGSGYAAYEWFQRALDCYKEAESLRKSGSDEPLFRWNAVVRTLERHPSLQPAPENAAAELLE